MLKAIIFDFDGLIIETEQPDFQSWQEAYQRYGCTLDIEKWLPLIGTGNTSHSFNAYEHLEDLLGRSLDRGELRNWRRQRYAELVARQPLMPGVISTIQSAQQAGLMLAVASSSTRSWVHGHLQERGLLSAFSYIVCGDEVAHAKPYPDLYNAAIQHLQIQPAEAIALEDSPNGVKAARTAGLFCIAIPGPMTRHCTFEDASLQLVSLEEFDLTTINNYI